MITFINILLICIMVLPKINIISISGSTVGIRSEDILIAVFILLELVNAFRIGKVKIKSKKMFTLFKYFLVYIFICLASTFYGVVNNWINPLYGTFYFIRKIEYFCLIFIGYKYLKKIKNLEIIVSKIDYLIIIHFFLSILQLLGIIGSFNKGKMMSGMTQGRVSSTFNGAYEFSGFLLLFFPLYLYKILNIPKARTKNIILIIMIMFCIYVSESRTSLVIMLLIAGLMLLKTSMINKTNLFRNIAIVFFAIIILLGAITSQKINLERFDTVNINGIINVFKITFRNKNFDKYVRTGYWYGNANYSLEEIYAAGMDASLYVRVAHWMQLLDGLKHSPFIGIGLSISGSAADGNYVRILSESGILGFIAWGVVLIYIWKNCNNSDFLSLIIKYCLISIVLGATLIDIFEASKIMMSFWFILGIYYKYEELNCSDAEKDK